MQAIKSLPARPHRPARQSGVVAVEFAVVALIFFTLFFGVVEIARVMYICNTLQEVTRRAAERATNTDFTDANSMQKVRETAVFRNAPGELMFAAPVSDRYVRIDYLSITRDASALTTLPVLPLPTSPQANQQLCMTDPNNPLCIRLVRVRICQPDDHTQCAPVPYESLVSFISLPLFLPTSTTIVVAETLGSPAGLPPGPAS